MENDLPSGFVLDLINSEYVTPATRQALLKRLSEPPLSQPHFFSQTEFTRLQRVCDHLIPQREGDDKIDIAGPIDERLSTRKTDGWRYDDLPDDGEAYRLFLAGINQDAEALYDHSFDTITDEQQSAVLRTVQQGESTGPVWQRLAADRFFEEMLAEVVEVYYSHPLAQQQIGYTGMADLTSPPTPLLHKEKGADNA